MGLYMVMVPDHTDLQLEDTGTNQVGVSGVDKDVHQIDTRVGP